MSLSCSKSTPRKSLGGFSAMAGRSRDSDIGQSGPKIEQPGVVRGDAVGQFGPMVLPLPFQRLTSAGSRALRLAPAFFTWLLLVAVAVLIASAFLGSATSPYGACYAPSGRTVPCDALKPRP